MNRSITFKIWIGVLLKVMGRSIAVRIFVALSHLDIVSL